MSESFITRLKRLAYNFFPVYRRTGARLTYIDDTWKEIRISIPLRLWTRNIIGTISGISMFGGVDPIYMVMLIKILGDDFVVWDKEATIRFKRPGRSRLSARFILDDSEIETIRTALETVQAIDRTYRIDLVDQEGMICATVEKTIHIARKKIGPQAKS